MKGLELAERFYLEYGAPLIHEKFSDIEHLLAVGLAGSGSECFGYDDELSEDHDFEAGFCIFIPDEDIIDRRAEFALERAYSKLPKEFLGYKRSPLNPVGGNRHGVIRMSNFFKEKTGEASGCLSLREWLFVPEQSLAEATNGKVFRDDLGLFSEIRRQLEYMPEDARLKKLAGHLIIMGQSGQYNYQRCVSRGENAAAQLAVNEFVKSALSVVFLLNKRYMPYYKWSFRALRELEKLSEIYVDLEFLLCTGNSLEECEKKTQVIERVCAALIRELRDQKITEAVGDTAEAHAYSVNDMIGDGALRNAHILCAV